MTLFIHFYGVLWTVLFAACSSTGELQVQLAFLLRSGPIVRVLMAALNRDRASAGELHTFINCSVVR